MGDSLNKKLWLLWGAVLILLSVGIGVLIGKIPNELALSDPELLAHQVLALLLISSLPTGALFLFWRDVQESSVDDKSNPETVYFWWAAILGFSFFLVLGIIGQNGLAFADKEQLLNDVLSMVMFSIFVVGVPVVLLRGLTRGWSLARGDTSKPDQTPPSDDRSSTSKQSLIEDLSSVENNQFHADPGAASPTPSSSATTGNTDDDWLFNMAPSEGTRSSGVGEQSSRNFGPGPPDSIPSAPAISVDPAALIEGERIGEGGNATVTKVTAPTPDGDVTLAIKRPRIEGTLHNDAVERFLKEAETWSKIDDHDHIVGVVDSGWGEAMPWIAMEYMDGGHLGSRISDMTFPQALWTAIGITKGVRHAHRREAIAHLDLKPENILFQSIEDAWDVPKVADWGLSKHLNDHSKTVEGKTFDYAAPEQFDTDTYGPPDDLTDVYQLGAVFYELFTGRPPFEGQPTEVMRAVLDDQPTPPSEIADVPDRINNILLKALAKEKTDRYESTLLVRNDLQDLYEEVREHHQVRR